MPANEKKLRYVLTANAIFSLVSGALLIVFHTNISELMDIINDQILMYIGIGLVLFSATVFHAGSRKTVISKQVKSIIVQDWAWVAGSMIIIAMQAWNLSSTAYWMIGAVALIVADFAIFQHKYLKKLV